MSQTINLVDVLKSSHIIVFEDDSKISKLDELIIDYISDKKYPLTKGLPFCVGRIQHCLELFTGTGKGDKPKKCDSCKLKNWCDYDKKKFEFKVVPIINCDEDLIKFLEERDENSADWI